MTKDYLSADFEILEPLFLSGGFPFLLAQDPIELKIRIISNESGLTRISDASSGLLDNKPATVVRAACAELAPPIFKMCRFFAENCVTVENVSIES